MGNIKEKRINVGDNRILICRTGDSSSVNEGILENGEVVRDYTLSAYMDYNFSSWSRDDSSNFNTMSYSFDINHPLYFPLFYLLNFDDELVIQDDETSEDYKKYLIIYKKDGIIYLDFNNFLKYDLEPLSDEKFHVFIKNVVFDGRSKIDHENKDTKDRLLKFFNYIYERIIAEDDKQISIEEYMIMNHIFDENMKCCFRKEYYVPFQRTRNDI